MPHFLFATRKAWIALVRIGNIVLGLALRIGAVWRPRSWLLGLMQTLLHVMQHFQGKHR